MLSILQTIAERKIQQAMAEGSLADLSHWKNKPLPPEITRLEQLLVACTDEKEKVRQLKKINCLKTKLECRTGRAIQLGEEGPYYNQVVDRLSTPKKAE